MMVLFACSYVDDVRFLLKNITRGLRYHTEVKQLIYDPAYEQIHANLSGYDYSSMVLRDIMNDVSRDMTFASEHQCEYGSKYLPTLGFQLQYTVKGTPRLRYKFYSKPMSSKLGIIQTSALSETTKANTITQETLRRMSNTSVDTTQQERNSILEEYITQLQSSGYSMDEIAKCMTPGIVGYSRRVTREALGGMPVHRDGEPLKRI